MASVYEVTIETKPATGAVGVVCSSRNITVITDTIQNAMAIGKCQCNSNEEVTYVYRSCRDPYIDYNSIKQDS